MKIVLNKKFTLRSIKDTYLLIPIRKNNISNLPIIINATSYFILNHLTEEPKSLQEILSFNKKKYKQISSEDEEYIKEYLFDLIDKKILITE